ncbi:MAG: signal peptidase II [Myxococcales bacterium]|nr:signal peptidase II [Myxococcales bacterium]
MTARLVLLFLALSSLVGCDHATKHWAESSLGRGGVTVMPGVFELRYAQNHDVAFNLLRDLPSPYKLLVVTTLAALATLAMVAFWWQRRKEAPLSEQVGFVLVLGGALGNLIDRMARGYVVDFLHLTHWPIFNVADILLCVGLGLLLVGSWRRRGSPPAHEAPA